MCLLTPAVVFQVPPTLTACSRELLLTPPPILPCSPCNLLFCCCCCCCFAGSTYFDSLQQEASFITTTNDPAGFTLVDTMAWGALGHALGFAILAATSSGVIPGVAGP
jgi:hypothetical protein